MEEQVDNSFNFDRRERDPKSILAWLLMHNPPEWIEKITKVPDYDVTNIRIDITVNGIPFGVTQFEEIVAPLAAAYAEHETLAKHPSTHALYKFFNQLSQHRMEPIQRDHDLSFADCKFQDVCEFHFQYLGSERPIAWTECPHTSVV